MVYLRGRVKYKVKNYSNYIIALHRGFVNEMAGAGDYESIKFSLCFCYGIWKERLRGENAQGMLALTRRGNAAFLKIKPR